MGRVIYFIIIVFCCFACDKEEVKPKTAKDIYKSWEGLYTYASYNKEKDTIYWTRYTIVIDSLNLLFINGKKREFRGEISQMNENEIRLKFPYENKVNEYRIVKTDTAFIPYGDFITKDSLEIENSKYIKRENYTQLKLSLKQLPKIYHSDYGSNSITVNSKNGLVLRSKPSLKSEKKLTIPNKTALAFISETAVYDYISLSKNNKVVGKWIQIYFKDKNGVYHNGYIYDYFVSYNYDIYDLPIDRSSDDPERSYIDVYNEKQFFDNLGNMTTLNIKAKKLNLTAYLKRNESLEFYSEDLHENSDSYYNMPSRSGYIDEEEFEMFLQGFYDLEITSSIQSVIKIPTLKLIGCEGVLFDNITFKTNSNNSGYDFILDSKTANVFFSNMTFKNQQFYFDEISYMPIQFQVCNFKGYSKSIFYSEREGTTDEERYMLNVENSRFWDNNTETLFEVYEENLHINNSFIGYNRFENLHTSRNNTSFKITETILRDNN